MAGRTWHAHWLSETDHPGLRNLQALAAGFVASLPRDVTGLQAFLLLPMTKWTLSTLRHRRAAVSPHIDQIFDHPIVRFETCVFQDQVSRASVMSDITSAIDRFRRDVEQIENNQATTLREMGHQIGRIVTAFQGILEEFTTSVTHIQKELETACETAKVKQIQLFTGLLDVQASIEYKCQRMSGLAQEITDAGQSATPSLEQLRNEIDGDREAPNSPRASGGTSWRR